MCGVVWRGVCSSVIFLLHIALEIPVAVQGLFFPGNLPFLDLNNTGLALLKVSESALGLYRVSGWLTIYTPLFIPISLSLSFIQRLFLEVVLLLCYASVFLVRRVSFLHVRMNRSRGYVTEFLPGKRALAIGFCVYHSTCSTILYQAPRFIPHTFGDIAES